MSQLQDEPLEKMVNDKLSEDIEVYEFNEEVEGRLRCYSCGYKGMFQGVIPAQDKRYINFVCPECNVLERVKNPEAQN